MALALESNVTSAVNVTPTLQAKGAKLKKVANAFAPIIAVDRKLPQPLHRQIYDAFRQAILGGKLQPGQQVPSTRALACELAVSRLPLLAAYAQLSDEGYFESRPGAGTYVSFSLPEQLSSCDHRGACVKQRSGSRLVSNRSALLPKFRPAPWMFGWGAFGVGQLAVDHFPFRIWSSLVNRHCRKMSIRALHFSDPMGSLELRKTIASYLKTARAVTCEPEQILVVTGSQQALEISASVLLDPGDKVWVEEPGYRMVWQVVRTAGCQLVPVPVDDEGLNVAAGIERCRLARAAYITPSHQFPLGVTMSVSRRLQLLEWAQRSGSWIIEDDYDSEYRYQGQAIASLQGLDGYSRVIYIGTFSTTVFPSLRLGYIVVPLDLVDRFVAVRHTMDVYPPHLYQAVLTDFIGEGHFARHIRRTRTLYRERRDALVRALRDEFTTESSIEGAEAGLHLVLRLPQQVDDRQLAERAAEQKLWLWPLSPCYLEKNPQQGLILGFGSTPPSEIPKAARRVRDLLNRN